MTVFSITLGAGLTYAEELPDQCPPSDAIEGVVAKAYRLCEHIHPLPSDFASKAAREEQLPNGEDLCRWSSCSLYEKASSLRKYKRLRAKYPYMAELSIPEGVGRWAISGKRGHVDFWRYAGNCLTDHIVQVEKL